MGEKDQAIVKALNGIVDRLEGLEQKDLTGAQTAQPMHGPGGLFTTAGLDDAVINTSLTPSGIMGMLPAFESVFTDPRFGFISGFEGTQGDEPSGACEDCPTSGAMQVCHQTAPFGRICRDSEEVEINKVMQKLHRGDLTDLRVIGDVLGDAAMAPQNANQRDWINYITRAQMVMVGIEFQRTLAPLLWQGNPANNIGDGYKEFPGLDILIGTGKIDALDGSACGSLDSDIKDFNYGDVQGASPDIVEYLSMMEAYLRNNARGMGLDPVNWVIAMRPQLWFELSSIWPWQYLQSHMAVNATGTESTVDATDMVDRRDQMREQQFITINGRRYNVVLDDGIYEQNSTNSADLAAGEFASDIYFLPLRAKNMPVTYMEFLDYRQAQAPEMVPAGQEDWWSTDGGRYMWTIEKQRWCFKVGAKIEPRVILRTPQLAGRLENVMYSPLQKFRSPYPDSEYFVKGGRETMPEPTYNNTWDSQIE